MKLRMTPLMTFGAKPNHIEPFFSGISLMMVGLSFTENPAKIAITRRNNRSDSNNLLKCGSGVLLNSSDSSLKNLFTTFFAIFINPVFVSFEPLQFVKFVSRRVLGGTIIASGRPPYLCAVFKIICLVIIALVLNMSFVIDRPL
jgi:hypothetical protein